MGKKISSEEKYKVVRQILRGKMSQRYAAEIMGVRKSSVQAWIRLYESEGAAALGRNGRNRCYSTETKKAAVREYLAGKGSLSAVCKKYHIRASVTLMQWIKVYNAHGRLTSKRSGGSYMRTSRKTTQDERLKIAKECLENGKNYGAMALKYQVSYQQVRTWTLRYVPRGPLHRQRSHGGLLGHFEAGALLWKAIYQQAGSYPDDPKLHLLLQHPACAA